MSWASGTSCPPGSRCRRSSRSTCRCATACAARTGMPPGLVREAVGLLRTAPAGSPAVDRVRVVLVDDAQELTLGGVELLEAVRARGAAVLAFGDPDVGSGSFRGATPENFARLAASLGAVQVLAGGHRGTPWQRDLVGRVTQRIGAVGVVAHRGAALGAEPDESVRVLSLRSTAEEYDAVARVLRERHVRDGVPWRDCAVIAHDTRQVAALEAELSAREVPARSAGPGRALGAVRPVADLLRLVELAVPRRLELRGRVGGARRHVRAARRHRAPPTAFGAAPRRAASPARGGRRERTTRERAGRGDGRALRPRPGAVGDAAAAGVRPARHARGATGGRRSRAPSRRSATISTAVPPRTSCCGPRGIAAASRARGRSSHAATVLSPSRLIATSTPWWRCSRRPSASWSDRSTPIRGCSCGRSSTAASPRTAWRLRRAMTACAS